MNDNNQNCIEENEIDLRELWATIIKYKFKIIIFSFFVTTLTVIYTLSIPNSYKSSILLAPQEKSKPSLGGLASLAGLAGINIGGSNADATSVLQATLKDYGFTKMLIKKYNFIKEISPEAMKKDMVFAFGYGNIYDMLHGKTEDNKTKNEMIYNTYKILQKTISINSDKKTGLITLSATTQDRFLSKKLVNIYLKELTSTVRNREMKDTNKKIKYYKNELANTSDITLKTQISNLVATLMQKKVLSQANEYYNVSKITDAIVPYIKDKVKPKRSLIIIVAFITSIILAIFGIFFIEFLRSEKEDE